MLFEIINKELSSVVLITFSFLFMDKRWKIIEIKNFTFYVLKSSLETQSRFQKLNFSRLVMTLNKPERHLFNIEAKIIWIIAKCLKCFLILHYS